MVGATTAFSVPKLWTSTKGQSCSTLPVLNWETGGVQGSQAGKAAVLTPKAEPTGGAEAELLVHCCGARSLHLSVLTSNLEQVTALWDAQSLLEQVLLNQETAPQTPAKTSQACCCPAQSLTSLPSSLAVFLARSTAAAMCLSPNMHWNKASTNSKALLWGLPSFFYYFLF